MAVGDKIERTNLNGNLSPLIEGFVETMDKSLDKHDHGNVFDQAREYVEGEYSKGSMDDATLMRLAAIGITAGWVYGLADGWGTE